MHKHTLFKFFKTGLSVLVFLLTETAHAETIQQALNTAYESNPTLLAARANQRATDETDAQARAGWRPTITIAAAAQYLRGPDDIADYQAGKIEVNDGTAALDFRQPLYTGGRVTNAVHAADARVAAGQQGLRATEATTFQFVIRAYMDVLRDQDIVNVRNADVSTLERQVRETTLRFRVGDAITRTDVAQAEAQRQAAKAAELAAQAQLATSKASYREAVGVQPGRLEQPGSLPSCPRSLDEAITLAEVANPSLAEKGFLADAAQDDVDTARSATLPTIRIDGQLGTVGPVAPLHTGEYEPNISATITLTQPLIAGGLVASQIRQAEDRAEAAHLTREESARTVLHAVTAAWANMMAGEEQIEANQAQVQAAALALKGYQEEYRFGLRTTLDLLIADQNLREAQVSLAESQNETIVAQAALLASVGRLEARTLMPAEVHYDPQLNFKRAKWAGAVPWEGVVASFDHGK